jgi:ABC-type antimicrobial peptide transport system permease subunit
MLESAIRRVVASIDGQAPGFDVQTLDEALSAGVAGPRFRTLLLGSFALIALVLTAVGLYGILAYAVLRRTREIGVRMALGAPRASVVGMVLKEALIVVAVGLSIGLVGAVAGNRLAATMVYGAGAPQAVMLAAACCVILVTAGLAAYVPARRAASIDPVRALRTE